jgi:hypothetical protein
MKKSSLIAFIILAVAGVSRLFAIEKSFNQPRLGSEIRQIMFTCQNPMQNPELPGKILAFIDRQMKGDANCKSVMSSMTEVIHKVWENNDWVNAEKDQILYDDEGFPTDSYNFVWDGSAWMNNSWSVITVDAEGKPIYYLMKIWTGSSWMDMAQVNYTYTSFGMPLQMLMQFNNGGSWINFMKEDFTYNAQQLATEILQQEWDINTQAWVNDSKDSFTYDNNGWMLEELSQVWEASAWVNEEIGYSTYDVGGHEIEKLKKAWYNNAWENYLYFTYTYNAQWLRIQEQSQSWYNSAWENHELFMFQYDAQDRIIEELYQLWVDSKGWENQSISNWTYDLSIGFEEIHASIQFIGIYPNPAADNAIISYRLDSDTFINIGMYSSSGYLIKELRNENQCAGEYKLELSTSGLTAGVYFVSFRGNNGRAVILRLVIIR